MNMLISFFLLVIWPWVSDALGGGLGGPFYRFTSNLRLLLSSANQELIMKSQSLQQYSDRVQERLQYRIRQFTEDLEANSMKAQQDFQVSRNRFSAMYNESLRILDKQRETLRDLEAGITSRPLAIDESLENFIRMYNGTEMGIERTPNKVVSVVKSIFTDSILPLYTGTGTLDPFRNQMDFASDNIKRNYREAMKVAGDMGKRADQLYYESTKNTQKKQNDLSRGAEAIFDRFYRNVVFGKGVLPSTHPRTQPIDGDHVGTTEDTRNDELKRNINRERRSVEQQIRGLERDSLDWIEAQKKSFEAQVKELQDSFRATNTAYEELITKRRASIYYTQQTDANLKNILDMIDMENAANSGPGGWQLMRTTEHGHEVYRRFFTFGPKSKYSCVMAKGIVKASPKKLLALFEDDTRVREYNNLFLRGEDLEYVAENTKIQWACTPPVFPFKPRDFVTLIHIRKLRDGTFVYMNTATTHPDKPAGGAGYVRGQILLAANIMQPVKGKPNLCKVTMMTQLDPGGFAPAPAVNKICLSGPGGFMRNIEVAANKAPSRAVLKEKKRLAAELKKRTDAKNVSPS